jgi:hypothetical protein
LFSSPPEFISSEAMGIKLPRRCPACKICKEFQFCMDGLSLKENAEYEVILGKLQLDSSRKKWVAACHINIYIITTMHRLAAA